MPLQLLRERGNPAGREESQRGRLGRGPNEIAARTGVVFQRDTVSGTESKVLNKGRKREGKKVPSSRVFPFESEGKVATVTAPTRRLPIRKGSGTSAEPVRAFPWRNFAKTPCGISGKRSSASGKDRCHSEIRITPRGLSFRRVRRNALTDKNLGAREATPIVAVLINPD